jgi:hypothetical protein
MSTIFVANSATVWDVRAMNEMPTDHHIIGESIPNFDVVARSDSGDWLDKLKSKTTGDVAGFLDDEPGEDDERWEWRKSQRPSQDPAVASVMVHELFFEGELHAAICVWEVEIQ